MRGGTQSPLWMFTYAVSTLHSMRSDYRITHNKAPALDILGTSLGGVFPS